MKRTLRSFNTRIFVMMLSVGIVPIVLCLTLMLPLLVSTSEHRQERSAAQQLGAMSECLGGVFLQADEALAALSGDARTAAAMQKTAGNPNAGRDPDTGKQLYAAMVGAASGCEAIANLYLFDVDGACLSALRGVPDPEPLATDWGVLHMAREEETVYCAAQEAGQIDAVRRLPGGAGYVLVRLDGEGLRALLSGAHDPSSGVMLLSPQWRLIFDTQTTGSQERLAVLRERLLAGEALSDGDASIICSAALEPVSGFTLLLSQPRAFTRDMTRMALLIGAAIGALSLMLCVIAARMLSRSLSRPVQEMTQAMARVQRGELSARVTPRTDDELGLLAQGFNRMAEQVEENLRRTVERQKELNETRIRMMQAQLNPHFLYNTLDSMKWMGITHGVPQVATLAQDLASILRTSISGEEFVTLGCELELLERYIDIQLIRFEDRFACEIEVDDALMNLLVPKMVLQPIVENAVIHGVRDMDDGYIKVYARLQEDELHLFVQDNGRGMDSEQSGALSFGVSSRPGEHLGLYNVDSILRLHFGDAYGLSIRSKPGEGCLVMVRLPVRRADKA